MNLEELRKAIDAYDCEVIQLLHKRVESALRLKRLKREIGEPDRERAVLDHVRSFAHPIVGAEFVERLYRSIIQESRCIQEKDLRLAGFQGEHGAYSEVAVQAYDRNLVPIPCPSFHEVFAEVASGQLDCGIVPVENSLEGAVTEVNDLLVETDLHIVGEISVPVRHCLLALPEQHFRDLRIVCSHPQALGQCRRFLTRHRLEARPFYDTAGAAVMLRQHRPGGTAVIASALCAELYHLEILHENIADHDTNVTRFIVLAREARPEAGDKCSILLSVSHRPGGLFEALRALAAGGINMTRIESRPLRQDPGRYAFFVDFEGSCAEERVKRALEEIRQTSTSFKLLGCYPGAGS